MPFSNQTQRMVCNGNRSFANVYWIVTLIKSNFNLYQEKFLQAHSPISQYLPNFLGTILAILTNFIK